MDDELRIRFDELTDNPSARVPISLVLDVSGSMEGPPIAELNRAIVWFMQALQQDEIAASAAEVNVVTFGGHVNVVAPFRDINRQQISRLGANGNTPMGGAVITALAELDQVKRQYQETGTDYYQPWLVLMTDGAPTDDITQAVNECQKRVAGRKLTVFPIAIGHAANVTVLSQFSQHLPPMRMDAVNLTEFFSWLSASVSQVVGTSMPGDGGAMDATEEAFKNAGTISWGRAIERV